MKKINFLIVLGLFVLLVGVAQPVYAEVWDYQNQPVYVNSWNYQNDAARINAAMAKFNGLLNAYSSPHDFEVWNQPIRSYSIEKQLSIAANDLSSSLEQFNTALMEVYPTLTEEGQLAIQNGVVDIIKALQSVTAETNLVFDREVFRIGYVSKIISIINSL